MTQYSYSWRDSDQNRTTCHATSKQKKHVIPPTPIYLFIYLSTQKNGQTGPCLTYLFAFPARRDLRREPVPPPPRPENAKLAPRPRPPAPQAAPVAQAEKEPMKVQDGGALLAKPRHMFVLTSCFLSIQTHSRIWRLFNSKKHSVFAPCSRAILFLAAAGTERALGLSVKKVSTVVGMRRTEDMLLRGCAVVWRA